MEQHATDLGKAATIATEITKLATGSGIIVFGGVLGYLKANNVPAVEDALGKAGIETIIDLAIAYTGINALSGAVTNRWGVFDRLEGLLEGSCKGLIKAAVYAAIGYGIGYGIGKLTR